MKTLLCLVSVTCCTNCLAATYHPPDQQWPFLWARGLTIETPADVFPASQIVETRPRNAIAMPAEHRNVSTPISIAGTIDQTETNGPFLLGRLSTFATFRSDVPVVFSMSLDNISRSRQIPAGFYEDVEVLEIYLPLDETLPPDRRDVPMSISVSADETVSLYSLSWRPKMTYIPEPSSVCLLAIAVAMGVSFRRPYRTRKSVR